MKKYNVNTGKIENLPSVVTVGDANKYTSKMTDAEIAGAGYLPIKYVGAPDRRYYTHTEEGTVVGGEYVVTYSPVARPVAEVQEAMLRDLNDAFLKYGERPRVDSTLGYFVDGSRTDKQNFEVGKKHGLPQVVDADNVPRNVTSADYDTILNAIELNGIDLWQTKQIKRSQILAFTTVEECALYEATPYLATVNVIDPVTLLPTGATQEVTLYKNNVKEW